MTVAKQLVSVRPEELRFQFELEQQSYCDLKVTNNTENNVAFKVKTTSPKKYYVRPNTGVIHPWDSCVIRVTLQAQKEYPPEMQCKDKFLLQSTVVPPNTEVDDLPQDTFNKEGAKPLEECKLRVVYMPPHTSSDKLDDGIKQNNPDQVLQRLQDERDKAVRQTQQLQQDLVCTIILLLYKSNIYTTWDFSKRQRMLCIYKFSTYIFFRKGEIHFHIKNR
ncbi:vesicle-associated protein 2-1 isoform X1 [Henckelia pumila]|uniref:vesicle-associated protein 2-1 isoform X1 n=1 Tax=Henckelia pumila TaxID=405737 RepID=UPI003C6E7B90